MRAVLSFAYAGCIYMYHQGSFRWGRGPNAETITRTGSPRFFWFSIALWAVLGTVVFVYNVRAFVRHLRERLPVGR